MPVLRHLMRHLFACSFHVCAQAQQRLLLPARPSTLACYVRSAPSDARC